MVSAWDCFHSATLELVRSTPIKHRLGCAFRHLAILAPEQVPHDVGKLLEQIQHRLQSVRPLRGEDAVCASVRKMSSQQADECAALIVTAFECLGRPPSQHRPGNTVVQFSSPATLRAERVDRDSQSESVASGTFS